MYVNVPKVGQVRQVRWAKYGKMDGSLAGSRKLAGWDYRANCRPCGVWGVQCSAVQCSAVQCSARALTCSQHVSLREGRPGRIIVWRPGIYNRYSGQDAQNTRSLFRISLCKNPSREKAISKQEYSDHKQMISL
jgi:hypothetical protein